MAGHGLTAPTLDIAGHPGHGSTWSTGSTSGGLVTDDFNRGDSADLGSPTGTNQDWAHTASTSIVSNEAVCTTTSTNAHVTIDATSTDLDVSAHFSGDGTNTNLSGPAFVDAVGSGSVYLTARYYPGNSNVLLVVYEPTPSVVATSATVATAETAFTLRMRRVGNDIDVWFDADETAELPIGGAASISHTLDAGDITLLAAATKAGANLWGTAPAPAGMTDIRVEW